jgi:hypothetical protein
MIHATGKVASSVVEGLKSQPLALPLVVVNLLALGLVAYVLHEISGATQRRDVLITDLAKHCIIGPKT